ncbi:MAG: DUF2330 domain-containing protein [Myxococcota bacterium]
MLSLIALAAPALACGGLFCDNVEPVDQTGETILFDVDEAQHQVEVQVRIAYQGPPGDFAWILPTPAEPDLFVGSNALFDALDGVTRPRLELIRDGLGCTADSGSTSSGDDDDASAVTSDATGVRIVTQRRVGPFDATVLTATDAAELTAWLTDHGYDLPAGFGDVVGAYLAPGVHFLALRLASDATSGEIVPIGLRYAGDHPSIPLRLTSVAATEDMPVDVYVLGPARAVPLNYLHVRLNPLALPYWQDATPLPERIARAADEAGGHAFVTTYAAPQADPWHLFAEGTYDTAGLATIADPAAFVDALPDHGFFGTSELLDVLLVHLPPPEGVDPTDFYDCPGCYDEAYDALAATFDPAAAAADLEARIVEPLRRAQARLDQHPYVTRLQTAVSPHEMTVDPMFGFNPDLPPVSNVHRAVVSRRCVGSEEREHPRTLEVTGLPALQLPPIDQMTTSDAQWVDERVVHTAVVVEQLSESGPGEVMADFSGEILWGRTWTAPGCGCTTGGASPAALLLLLPLAWTRRRR